MIVNCIHFQVCREISANPYHIILGGDSDEKT